MWWHKLFNKKEYLYCEMNVWRAIRVISRDNLNIPDQGLPMLDTLCLERGGVVIQFSKAKLEKLGYLSGNTLISDIPDLMHTMTDMHSTRAVLLIAANDLPHLMRANQKHYRTYERAFKLLSAHARLY